MSASTETTESIMLATRWREGIWDKIKPEGSCSQNEYEPFTFQRLVLRDHSFSIIPKYHQKRVSNQKMFSSQVKKWEVEDRSRNRAADHRISNNELERRFLE